MKIIRALQPSKPISRHTIAALGNFDGLHLGHQHILSCVLERSRSDGAEATVITFDPHPNSVVAPHRAPALLSTLDTKLGLISEQGIDSTLVIPFTLQTAAVEPETFIEEILVQMLGIQHIVVGPDCRFGKKRRGDIALLREAGLQHGFTVQQAEHVLYQGDAISSSRIRQVVAAGDIEAARVMLNKPFRLSGIVEKGDQRGRQLGFPTANIAPDERMQLPGRGVYQGTIDIENKTFLAAVNVGLRPTFEGKTVVIEAHILDFDRDLYGQTLSVDFHHFLRPERKFPNLEDLVNQLRQDVATVRQASIPTL